MKKLNGFLSILLPLLLAINSSCRKEEYVFVGTPPEQVLLAGSNVANLLLKTTMNDGSIDNIIDGSNCFTVELPVTVVVNGTEIIVVSQDDYETIEAIFDEDEIDADTLEIIFPIAIVLNDFTRKPVLTVDELQGYADDCQGENEEDDDIECISIQYPITVSIFNTNNEIFNTISFLSDMVFYGFLNSLTDDDIVSIDFPISLLLYDGTSIGITNLFELENAIENAKDICDEDDDNDVNDDDCVDCTSDELLEVWTECVEWEAHVLQLDGETLDTLYTTFLFNFQLDGVVLAVSDTETLFGTWVSSSSATTVSLEINIPGLNDFNNVWELQEIARTTEDTDVRLILDQNKVHFKSVCTVGDPGNNPGIDVSTELTNGIWQITTYLIDDIDQTLLLGGYTLTFNTDGEVIANNLLPINGTWSLKNDNAELAFDFGLLAPLDLLNGDWVIVSVSETQIELQHSTLGGIISTLILTK